MLEKKLKEIQQQVKERHVFNSFESFFIVGHQSEILISYGRGGSETSLSFFIYHSILRCVVK